MLRKIRSYHSYIFIFSLVILPTLWGCASSGPRVTQSDITFSPSSLSPVVPFSSQATTAEMEVVTEELTIPEPDITLAEEVEKLGRLGKWEEGAPEDVPAEPEITYDFPVTMNKQVEFYLDFFQNKQKSPFTRWLERSGRYLPMMQAQLKEAGLTLDLVYLPMI